MGASVAAATRQIDQTGGEGDLTGVERVPLPDIDPEDSGPEVHMPDGSVIYMPRIFGQPIDEIAYRLLDFEHPSRSKFIRLTGPPGTGKSRIGRAIALRAWKARGRKIQKRDGEPFYGYVEMTGGPSSDEHTFRNEVMPSKESGDYQLIDSVFVQAMREGWVVMIDEPNGIRDVALLSLNSVFDGRLSLYLPAEAKTIVAKPGFACLLAYNPGLTSAISDLPQSWYGRFPACLEVTTNWAGLVKSGVPQSLVAAAKMIDQDRLNADSPVEWSPQYREIESLHHMIGRISERHGIAMWISSLAEMQAANEISPAALENATRILDQGGYIAHKHSATTLPNVNGYLRAVTA